MRLNTMRPSHAPQEATRQVASTSVSGSGVRGNARFTLRLKVFVAFALLATVGGSGGVLSLFRLHEVARIYQNEQSEVAVHEAVHEDRIALLSLLDLVNRHQYQPERDEPKLHDLIEKRMLQLGASTETCNGCHSHLPAHVEFTAQLNELRQGLASLLKPAFANPAGGAVSLAAVEASITALEDSRGRMEARFHQLLDRRRDNGKDILQPTVWQHLALVFGGLAAALLLAWLISRATSRHIMPLIVAARRIGSGDVSRPVEVPHDPDLAQVAVALNEMAALVAQQASEDARRQLLNRTLSSQEDERRRVARELHDTLGQSLSALLMEIKSRNAHGQATVSPVDGNGLEARVSCLLDEVHRIAWDLRPPLLDDLGLHSALDRYTEELAQRRAMPIDFQVVGLAQWDDRLPRDIETVLYRVAQEALHNVVRHAHASRASVVLVRRDQEVALLVEDDGSGFDVETIRRDSASLGILGMQERVALAGGGLTIVSAAGKGTTVRAQIPLSGLPT